MNNNVWQVVKKHTHHLLLSLIVTIYVILALLFSSLTPAWEANDELQHTQFVQYLAVHKELPDIKIENGHESHQPPLYYIIVAGWQTMLGMPPFTPDISPPSSQEKELELMVSHDYTKDQLQDALSLKKLRLLSIIFGVLTITITYLIGYQVSNRRDIAVASAAFVALLPKFIVVSAVVTNDALVIPLSTLSLFILILWMKNSSRRHYYLAFLLGLTGGLAVLTKLNSAPLVGVLFIVATYVAVRTKRTLDVLLIAVGFVIPTSWWFIHNIRNYGDPLARAISNDYLIPAIPNLIREDQGFNFNYFFVWVPKSLMNSFWYNGGWNQWVLPGIVNLALFVLASICLISAVKFLFYTDRSELDYYMRGAVLLSFISGIVAVVLIAISTHQAEGRVVYVGLAAFAFIMTVGIRNIMSATKFNGLALLLWPLLFFMLNIYIIVQYLYPLKEIV